MSVRPKTWNEVAKAVPGSILPVPTKQFWFVLEQFWRTLDINTGAKDEVRFGFVLGIEIRSKIIRFWYQIWDKLKNWTLE